MTRRLVFCVLGVFFHLMGCISESRYRYDVIQNEYRDLLCNLSPVDTSRMAGGACVLDKPLSLSDAIQVALANNPDNQMAIARIKQASAVIEQAKARYYPTLGFYTEYLQGDAPSAYLFRTIDQRQLPDGVDFNNPGWFQNYETGVNAGLNLFDGGRTVLKEKIALTGLAISELDRQSIENELIASVIQTYYNCLVAKAFITIATESVGTVKEQLRVMEVRYRAGGALKSDILSLEVRLAQAKQDVVRSENRRETALTSLGHLLGVSTDPPIGLSGADLQTLSIPQDSTAGITEAVILRPELKRVRERVRQSRMALDVARSEFLPRIDAQAKYYYDDPNMSYNADRENWTAGVILNWDLFTGFSTRAAGRKAAAAVEEALTADRKMILSIKHDVKTAYLNLAEAKARLQVADASVASAEESLSLVKKQYEGGSVTITRYLEAELDRNRARSNATAAFYDKEKAYAEVARAIGLLGKSFRNPQGKSGP